MPHFQRSSLLLFAAPPPVAPTTYWTKHPPTLLYYLDFTYFNPNCMGRAPNPAADFCRVAQSSRPPKHCERDTLQQLASSAEIDVDDFVSSLHRRG
ncbi:hypothetical protein QC762_0046550 [Podospora pseudocomata]|uniref:Uncharacterized protein n=1 Tax=Podospora pseudocomata TaxID=2093779 RepID=A0ABR0GPB6_9PEZI|nr:hypothetical protein QC762_0046550 [Podospora pseudocomata]